MRWKPIPLSCLLFLTLAATDNPPSPQGFRPRLEPISPKLKEHRDSLGRPMARRVAPTLVQPLAPIQGLLITNITVNSGQVTMAWQGSNQVFQVLGSHNLQAGSWSTIGGPTTAHTKTFDPDFTHYFIVQGNIVMPLEITHTNPTTLEWSIPELAMGDSINPFHVYDAPSVPPNDTPSSTVGWREVADGTPASPIPTNEPLTADGKFHIDDTQSLPRAYKVIEQTLSGVQVPYSVQSASMTTPGSVIWASAYGTAFNDNAAATAVGNNGNVIVVGDQHGQIFVLSYSSSGILNAGWPLFFGQGYGTGVAVDANNNIYAVAGSEPTQGFPNAVAFLIKLSPSGATLWTRPNDLVNGSADARKVCVDSNGDIIVTGRFFGTLDFGNGHIGTAVSTWDFFLVKYHPDGTCVWLKTFTSSNTVVGTGVGVDANNNIYVTGNLTGTADVTGNLSGTVGHGLLSSPSGTPVPFLVRYGASGIYSESTGSWSKSFNNTGSGAYSIGIGVTPDGKIAMAGKYLVDFNIGGGDYKAPITTGGYVAQFASDGSYRWSQNLASSDGGAEPLGVATDLAGNVAVTGTLNKSFNFGHGLLSTTGGTDIYVAKYDSTGLNLWASSFGSTLADSGYGVAFDPNNVVSVGRYSWYVNNFGKGPAGHESDPFPFVGQNDTYVLKLAQ